jgi:hypothetical protein
MSDLEQSKDKAIAPVTSMLPQATALNVLHAIMVEKKRYSTFHHVTKAQSIYHMSEPTIARTNATERHHRIITTRTEVG